MHKSGEQSCYLDEGGHADEADDLGAHLVVDAVLAFRVEGLDVLGDGETRSAVTSSPSRSRHSNTVADHFSPRSVQTLRDMSAENMKGEDGSHLASWENILK